MNDRSFAYRHVDVFTERAFEGNQLAVFTDPGDLDGREMQAIALELNLAETVFVLPPASAQSVARLRIFTPRRELMFAGHPTIGAVAVLIAERGDLPDAFTVELGAGSVPIRVEPRDGAPPLIWLTTPPVTFGAAVERVEAARILGLEARDVADATPRYASAGSPFLFVPLHTADAVDRAAYVAGTMPSAACPDAVGVFLFTTAHARPEAPNAVYARMFAPWSGIPEDPATGSATGPLAAYLLREDFLQHNADELRLVSEQGARMGRRSILHVRITRGDGDEPVIEVGGNAVPVARGTMSAAHGAVR